MFWALVLGLPMLMRTCDCRQRMQCCFLGQSDPCSRLKRTFPACVMIFRTASSNGHGAAPMISSSSGCVCSVKSRRAFFVKPLMAKQSIWQCCPWTVQFQRGQARCSASDHSSASSHCSQPEARYHSTVAWLMLVIQLRDFLHAKSAWYI